MRLSIIIIGDEILLGQVTDTNSGEIARILGPQGWEVVSTRVVGDDGEAIRRAVEMAMGESDMVITTGGLGPTKDDITKVVLMQIFGGELYENKEVLATVENVFAKRGLKLNDLTRSQAMVPTSCRVIQNVLGTAPIMWFEKDGKVLISMPGVPFEAIGMLKAEVKDEIAKRFSPDKKFIHHTLMVSGITESDLAERLDAFEKSLPQNVHLAYLPSYGYIRLRLDCAAGIDENVSLPVEELKDQLGEYLIYDGDAAVAEILLHKLKSKGYTLATAESCTGGNIAHLVTLVPGSSESYMGSVVSYSNDVKRRVLNVRADDLAQYGAVSESVVRQMAEGVAKTIGTDCSIATSGIAGPSGGSEEKPVGTVWIAVRTPKGVDAKLCRFGTRRQIVIERASTEAMLMLIRSL